MMAKALAIKKDRSLTADAVLKLLADVTEQADPAASKS